GWKFTLPFDPLLLNYIRKEKIDIIQFHTPAMLGMQAIIIAKALDIPLIGTFHTFIMDPQYLKHIRLSHRLMEKFAWKWSNAFYNRCDLITCPSERTKAELIAKNCKKPMKVIPYGIDLSEFDNAKSPSVRRALNKKGKLLLFVGRLAYEKNIPYLLECFALMLRKLPNTRLVIVGDGPQEKLIKAKIRALGISKSVIFTGSIGHDKLVKSGIFGACDVFIHASTTETGPITLLEAQANGLVSVVVEGPGMNLVTNNVNGYVVGQNDKKGFADAVVTLLTDAAKYNRMKKATLRIVRKYEISHVIEDWEMAYEKLRKVGRR
ncbi:MAG: glycosyltransferase, partial [Candidatus Woesearchaeota archaeon]